MAAGVLAAFQMNASATTYAPNYTGPIADDFVTSGAKWGASQVAGTPGGTVTYSFMPTGTSDNGEGHGGGTFTHVSGAGLGAGVFEAQTAAAFLAWETVANIQFSQVADTGYAFDGGADGQGTDGSGDIRIGLASFDGPSGVLAHGYFPQPGAPSFAGDIHFDVAETWKVGFGGAGFDVVQVMAHELGHAIGLNHTGVPGSLMEPFYTEAFSGPQTDDINGAQFLYGRNIPLPPGVPDAGGSLALGLLGLLGMSRFFKRQAN